MQKTVALFLSLFFFIHYGNAGIRIGPRLHFILKAQQSGNASFYALPELEKIPITFTFDRQISSDIWGILEKTGFQPHLYKDQPLHSQRVLVGYLQNPAKNLTNFYHIPHLLEIETSWRPHHAYPLTVSRQQIEADQVWQLEPLAGRRELS